MAYKTEPQTPNALDPKDFQPDDLYDKNHDDFDDDEGGRDDEISNIKIQKP